MRKADNLPPSCAVVTKSGKLNFLEPFGPVQVRNGPAIPLPFTFGRGVNLTTQFDLVLRLEMSGAFVPTPICLHISSSRYTPYL